MAGRARAELAARSELRPDKSWEKWELCEFCGREIIVNNYPDKKPRTPKFLGLIICPWCEPRHIDDRWLWRMKPEGPKPRMMTFNGQQPRSNHAYRTAVMVWVGYMIARSIKRGESPEKIIGTFGKILTKQWSDKLE